MARFRKVWAGLLQSWVAVMEARYREVWATEFLPLLLKDVSGKKNRDIFFFIQSTNFDSRSSPLWILPDLDAGRRAHGLLVGQAGFS
jgi:hypothetical protein